jgi:DNA polymerase III, alpha subunit
MDIDIDLKPDFKLEQTFPTAIRASIVEKGELKKHLVGAYFQNIPKDNVTELAAIPYQIAGDHGFMKIDFLSLKLLAIFESKEEVLKYARTEPNWKNLARKSFVEKLFHISAHYDTVSRVKPTSILELADVLTLIRPGKMILLDKYLKNKKAVRPELYTKRSPSDLRKSHAIAYATNVVINMNLLEEQEI